jgi:hypothetical protein
MGKAVHEHCTVIRCAGGQKQVDVICHQTVGVHGARTLLGQLSQQCQVNEIVACFPEAVHTIIAALNDMDRRIGDDQALLPRHKRPNDHGRYGVDGNRSLTPI